MLIGEEFVRGLEHYGRWHMQEYVARSQEITDVLTYLRAERILEMFRAASYLTVDSIHFLRRTDLLSATEGDEGISQQKG